MCRKWKVKAVLGLVVLYRTWDAISICGEQ
jgi:hypothetical protein